MPRGHCVILDCSKEAHYAQGYCPMHYQRWKKNGDPLIKTLILVRKKPVRHVDVDPCSVEGCEKLMKARGWCMNHYMIWRKKGSPTARLQGQVVDGRRICPGCGIDKLLEEYTPNTTGRCRRCAADRRAEWRRNNPPEPYVPERGRARAVAWRKRNPDKVRATAALYRARKVAARVEVVVPREVFERDGWVCGICLTEIDRLLKYPHQLSVSLDHVIPLSRGGAHSLDNTQASHLICNEKKHAKTDKVA